MTEKEKIEQETVNLIKEAMELKLEMAYSLETICRKVDDKCEIVNEHLILCFIFRNNSSLEHWKSEVYSNLKRTYKVKSTNRYPSEKQLQDNCFGWLDSFLDTVDAEIKSLGHQKQLRIPRYNKNNLYHFVKTYYIWLFRKFSKNGIVTDTEVYNCIDNLLQQFSLD